MAQLKSSTQSKLDVKADIDANSEVMQLAVGAAAEVTASRPKASKRADGTWLESLGEGQSYQDVTATRSIGTSYTNATGKPISVSVTAQASSTTSDMLISVDGIQVSRSSRTNSATTIETVSAIVPNGSTYILNATSIINMLWVELR